MTNNDVALRVKDLIADLSNLLLNTPWSNLYCNSLNKISQEISNPCRLAITGRVKAGKSSLINVLLNGDYAKVGTDETTATINIFKYGEAPDKSLPVLCEYIMVNRNGCLNHSWTLYREIQVKSFHEFLR